MILYKCFYKYGILLVLLLAACLTGCSGLSMFSTGRRPPPPVLYAPGEAPQFLVRYLPYPSRVARLSAPIPDYEGWTEERMERELRLMTRLGLDGVVMEVDGDVFRDSFRSDRVRRFVQLAANRMQDNHPFTVALCLTRGDGQSLSLSPDEIAAVIEEMLQEETG